MDFRNYSDFVMGVTSDNSKLLGSFIRNVIDRNTEATFDDTDCIPHLLTAALGLCGEAAEVQSLLIKPLLDHDKLKDELGDVLWYITQGCFALNILLSTVYDEASEYIDERQINFHNRNLTIACGEFADIVKKVVLHGKTFEEKKAALYEKLVEIMAITISIIEFTSNMTQVMEMNMNKLSKRHSNGFNKDYKSDSQTG